MRFTRVPFPAVHVPVPPCSVRVSLWQVAGECGTSLLQPVRVWSQSGLQRGRPILYALPCTRLPPHIHTNMQTERDHHVVKLLLSAQLLLHPYMPTMVMNNSFSVCKFTFLLLVSAGSGPVHTHTAVMAAPKAHII